MRKRNLLMMIVLSFLTLGIYSIYWYCSFQSELKRETNEGFGGLGHLLATIFTFGIYYIVWSYNAGKRLEKQGAEDWSLIYLILTIVGLGIINMLLMQNQANNLNKN